MLLPSLSKALFIRHLLSQKLLEMWVDEILWNLIKGKPVPSFELLMFWILRFTRERAVKDMKSIDAPRRRYFTPIFDWNDIQHGFFFCFTNKAVTNGLTFISPTTWRRPK